MPYKDKEKNAECKKLWAQNNKQKRYESCRKYRQTPKGIMMRRITDWKYKNIKLPEEYGKNWDIFYELEYMGTTNCEECNVELTEEWPLTSTTRCLDHDHDTGEFRNILCNACNTKRG